MKLSVIFLVLSVQIFVAAEATKTWSEWVKEGTALFAAGNYREAAQAFRQALTAAETSGVAYHPLVRIISSLASAYSDAGQFSESEKEWRHALALVNKTEGPESLNYALLVAGLAVLPTQTENREETIATIRTALASYGQSGSYRDLSWLRRCLAQILIQQKRYDDAEALLRDWQANSAQLKEAGSDLSVMSLNELRPSALISGALRMQPSSFANCCICLSPRLGANTHLSWCR